MDLVAHEHEVVAAAEVDDPLDLVAAPDAAERVVRMAEQEHAGVGRRGGLEAVERELPAAVPELGRHGDQPPAAPAGRLQERRVDRRDRQHGLAGRGERVAGEVQSRHDARQPHDPLAVDAPAVATLEVGDDRLDQGVGHQRVAEDAVSCAGRERLDHLRRRGEVHVRDPQRQRVAGVEVPLEAGGAPPLDGGVEVEVHAHRLAEGRPVAPARKTGLLWSCILRRLLFSRKGRRLTSTLTDPPRTRTPQP